MKYERIKLEGDKWVITSIGHNYKRPQKAVTFAFDTETQVYFKGKLLQTNQLFKKVRNLNNEQKRKALKNVTWAWQIYDDVNGFFMTNDFYEFLSYQCRCGYKFGWCYNATFDFAQIDYEILAKGLLKWKPHTHHEKGSHKGYNKGQAWTYESLHNDMGARYAYKLWLPYKHKNRHNYVHAVEYHDFMKLIAGGLARLLKDLNVVDNEGHEIRKLTMEYQAVNTSINAISDDDIAYCENDVKGLFFAIKMFNETIEKQSNNELHIFGPNTNIMTAGGFAKYELLRSLYPNEKGKRKRIKAFQKQHPITQAQDEYLRKHHLYRGGLCIVNPLFKGKMITKRDHGLMYRYDVNSEYPYSMTLINDLIGKPIKKKYEEYLKMQDKDNYEAVLILNSASGIIKDNYIGVWYDPFKREFVDVIDENETHLMFERELNELSQWYDDLTISCDDVLLWRKGGKVYTPFVIQNYQTKAQAKAEGNKTLLQIAKLLLNSSYGKLAERVEREKGHYELNKDTGAIHFVREGVEIDTKSMMNVAIGALITATARCYILSKIREICGDDIKHNFVYIDTDSIHCFNEYEKADAINLGGLKLEATCEAIKYIAPKTYVDIEKVNDDFTVDYDKIELHSKGINLEAIKKDLKKKQKGKRKGKPLLSLIDAKINYGAKYVCLVAMNVQGGKVLIPCEKFIAREELRPADDTIFYTNYEKGFFTEV